MRILFGAAAACVALACFAAVPAQAQRIPTLRAGQTVEGRLARSDPQMTERGRFKVYQFRAEPGVRYVATLRSAEFDAFLLLGRTVGGVTDYMRMDDDGAGATNARLRFGVEEAGTYLLIAQSLEESGLGEFALTLDTASTGAAAIRDAAVGDTLRAELTPDDAPADPDAVEDGAAYVHLYRFDARAGQRLRIRVQSPEFHPTVAVGTLRDGEFVVLQRDTGYAGANADGGPMVTVGFRVPEDGEYAVRVGGSVGEYRLAIEERRATQEPRPVPIRRGQTVTDTLGAGDAELDDGRWFRAYAYPGRAGEPIRVALRSDAFDTVLRLGRVVDGEFQEIAANDDAEGGDDTNSVLETELPADGRYVIHVTSFEAGEGGAYRLTVAAPR